MKRTCIAVALLMLVAAAPHADATVRCATRDLDAWRGQIRPIDPGRMVRSHAANDPMRPPPNPQVGDSWLWYTWRLNGPPQADLKMCTVRGKGTHVYVVVENSQWLTRVNQADVDAIVDAWDNRSDGIHPDRGIYDLDTMAFGPAPDELDHDPRIYVLFYAFDIAADGFFWPFDEYPDGSQPYHSNECEVLYINSAMNDPGGTYLISVMAHEFEHMIHWLADSTEEAWVDEGMAELAMYYYGHPDQITGFPANPDNDLTTFNGVFADYVKVYLWNLYFYEQCGGEASGYAVVQDPAHGIAGYQDVMNGLSPPRAFDDVYADWVVANFIDDTSFDRGEYGYRGTDLPPFAAVVKQTYPVPPASGTVQRYAADYVKFTNGTPQRLWFDGADAATWRPRVVFRNGTTTQQVVDVPLNQVAYGTVDLFGFGSLFDTAILVIGKTAPANATSYQYGTQGIPAGAPEEAPAIAFGLGPAEPNPMRGAGSIRLDLPHSQHVAVSVVDPSGRLVRTLASGAYAAGSRSIRWDGRDERGRVLPAGVYFVSARGEDGTATARWVRVE